MNDDIVRKLEEVGWSLDFVYLDGSNNRFLVQKQGQDFVKEAQEELARQGAKVSVKETVASMPSFDESNEQSTN